MTKREKRKIRSSKDPDRKERNPGRHAGGQRTNEIGREGDAGEGLREHNG